MAHWHHDHVQVLRLMAGGWARLVTGTGRPSRLSRSPPASPGRRATAAGPAAALDSSLSDSEVQPLVGQALTEPGLTPTRPGRSHSTESLPVRLGVSGPGTMRPTRSPSRLGSNLNVTGPGLGGARPGNVNSVHSESLGLTLKQHLARHSGWKLQVDSGLQLEVHC
jgi:hypothetical protein